MIESITVSQGRLRDVANILQLAALNCGNIVTARQVQALLLIAEANKAGREITRGDLEDSFGNVGHGTVSKMLRGMMHVTMERKGDLADTVKGVRSADDLRVVHLYLTEKGRALVNTIAA